MVQKPIILAFIKEGKENIAFIYEHVYVLLKYDPNKNKLGFQINKMQTILQNPATQETVVNLAKTFGYTLLENF